MPLITMTSAGDMYQSISWFKNVPIKIQDYALYENFIEIDITDYDVILVMDWLLTHHALTDCRRKLCPLKAEHFKF